MLPVGLLGEVRKIILLLGVIAAFMASRSMLKLLSRSTEIHCPPHIPAENEYMPKVGDGTMTLSPIPTYMRSSRSINSSLPFPATIFSDSTFM